MNEERYCVTLSNSELALLISSRGVRSFFGYELDMDEISDRVAAQTLLKIAERGLVVVEEDELFIRPELRRLINNIATAQCILYLNVPDYTERNCFVYCTRLGCTVVISRSNGGFMLINTKLGEWIDELCDDYIPMPFKTAQREFSDTADNETFVSMLMSITVYGKNGKNCIDTIRINNHMSFGSISSDNTEAVFYTDGKLKTVLNNVIGEEYGIC